MKRIVPFRIVLVCALMIAGLSVGMAQTFCNLPCPDPSVTAPAEADFASFDLASLFVTEGDSIPDGVVGSPYCVNISVAIPDRIINITGQLITEADITSVTIDTANFNLPAGLKISCGGSCVIPGNNVGCMQIAGVPTQPIMGDTIRGAFNLLLLGGLFDEDYTNVPLAGINILSNPLPVELTSFQAFPASDGNVINWTTAAEWNNQGFVIQHSLDAQYFTDLAFVESDGHGNDIKTYSWLDRNAPTARSYYRLKQVDLDGSESYSEIIELSRPSSRSIEIYPNPVLSRLQVDLPTNEESALHPSMLTVRNLQGVLQLQSHLESNSSAILDVSMLPAGLYVLEVKSLGKQEFVRFLKQ